LNIFFVQQIQYTLNDNFTAFNTCCPYSLKIETFRVSHCLDRLKNRALAAPVGANDQIEGTEVELGILQCFKILESNPLDHDLTLHLSPLNWKEAVLPHDSR